MTDRLHIVSSTTPAAPAPRKAVAVVGFTAHRTQAPLGDPDWECWGLNELYRYLPLEKFSRWFELHARGDFERPVEQGGDPDHIAALKQFPLPVYMTQHWDDIPASVPLPRDLIQDRVSSYMTSSIAWMMALAMAEGATTIGLFGIDMAQDTEYAQQRPCMEFLIGMAIARGIRVILPKQSDLLKAVAQYGFESEGGDLMLKMLERKGWLESESASQQQKLAKLEADYADKSATLTGQYQGFKQQLVANLNVIKGSLDDITYWMRSWGTQPSLAPAGVPANPLDRGADPKVGAIARLPQGKTVEPEAGDTKTSAVAHIAKVLPPGVERIPADYRAPGAPE